MKRKIALLRHSLLGLESLAGWFDTHRPPPPGLLEEGVVGWWWWWCGGGVYMTVQRWNGYPVCGLLVFVSWVAFGGVCRRGREEGERGLEEWRLWTKKGKDGWERGIEKRHTTLIDILNRCRVGSHDGAEVEGISCRAPSLISSSSFCLSGRVG